MAPKFKAGDVVYNDRTGSRIEIHEVYPVEHKYKVTHYLASGSSLEDMSYSAENDIDLLFSKRPDVWEVDHAYIFNLTGTRHTCLHVFSTGKAVMLREGSEYVYTTNVADRSYYTDVTESD